MFRVVAAMAFVVIGVTSAWAGPASFVQGYNGISVAMSPDAAKCGLKDANSYNARLAERLFEADVPLDGLLPASARLALSASPFSQIGGKCVVIASLAFTIPMNASDIEVDEVVTNRAAIVSIFEQIGTVPIVLYENTEFVVSEADAGDQAALKLIDELAQRFGADR